MNITTYLMIAAAACLIAGLLADAVCDSDEVGNALIILAIIVMLAAFFSIEAPGYLSDVEITMDVPRELRD